MKPAARLAFLLLSLTLAFDRAQAEALPEFRPALLGRHKRSLIDMINTEALMKRGQGEAIVMFSCAVSSLGFGYSPVVYRGSPNSDRLKDEVSERIKQAQFEPAVYNHAHVPVYIDGTVSFGIVDGKPRLRIFLNQEEEALTRGHDFIAPQLAFIPGTKFKGFRYPPSAPGVAGLATVTMDVDEKGKVGSQSVSYEHPANLGFGAAVAGPLRDAAFIPGFRNGKPVSCRFTTPIIFTGPGSRAKTG